MSSARPDSPAARELASQFRRYTPPLLSVLGLVACGSPQAARAARRPAVILNADLVGFTGLTERLATRSPRGVEDVQRLLNEWFRPMIKATDDWGGQVLHFAGDAVVGLWPCRGTDAVPTAVRYALACARVMMTELERRPTIAGFQPRLRVGIAAGEVWAAALGGVEDRWELLVAGSAIERVARPLALAEPGDVVLAGDARKVVVAHVQGTAVDGDGLRVTDWGAPIAPPPPNASPPQVAAEALAPFVPRTLRAKLEAGQEAWLSEFRRVSVAFIKVQGLDYAAPDILNRAQEAVRCVQRAVFHYGGSINQLVVDDTGTTVVAVWGVALKTNEDDPARATRATLRTIRDLKAVGLGGRAGVATAKTFTGQRGSEIRSEFAVIGDAVNLAARLAETAAPILCDRATQSTARAGVLFQSLEPVTLKGRSAPVPVARPLATKAAGDRDRPALVGRVEERRLLSDQLRALEERRVGSLVFIEGQSGIGKSALVRDFLQQTQGSTVRGLVGSGDSVERTTPYFAWRAVFDRLLDLKESSRVADRQARVLADAAGIEGFDERASLLNPLLSCEFTSTPLVESMPARGRADATRQLAVELLARGLRGQPGVIVLEDAHWMDSASWALAVNVKRQITPLLLVIVARPNQDDASPTHRALSEAPDSHRIELHELTPGETVSLVCRRLDVEILPSSVVDLVDTRAGGHPLFAEQLAYALRDRALIRVEQGECLLAAGFDHVGAFDMPDTVQDVLTSRIDLMSPDEQLTIKVASVIGQAFGVAGLTAVHPVASDPADVMRQLDRMADLDLLSRLDGDTFKFRHEAVRDVAYGLLTSAQSRDLHRAAAEWFERFSAQPAESLFGLLAHHWVRAEVTDKAVATLEQAGEVALRRTFANDEARGFFTQLVELVGGSPERAQGVTPFRWATWQRALGEAEANLGRHAQGCPHLERCLDLLGHSIPPSRASLRKHLVTEGARQLLYRTRPPGRGTATGRDARLEAIRAFSRLGGAYYVLDRRLEAVYTLLKAANLGEALGVTPELAVAFADLGNLAGVLPAHRLARMYVRLAKTMADQVGEATCRAEVLIKTSLYRRVVGDWEILTDLDRALRLCDQFGNHFLWAVGANILAHARYLRGDLRDAYDLTVAIEARARDHDAKVPRQWSLQTRAECALRLGETAEALSLAGSTLASMQADRTPDPQGMIQLQGTLASAWLRQGEPTRAYEAAEAASQDMKRASLTGYGGFQGHLGVIEVYAATWAAGGADRDMAAERARHFVDVLERFATRYHVAGPSALRLRGVCESLAGRRSRACRLWERSLQSARALDLRHDEGAALLKLGRHLEGHSRTERLAEAVSVFRAIGASADLAAAENALRATPGRSEAS